MSLSKMDEKTLTKVQVVSGGVFASFLGLHIINTITAIGGQLLYDGAMDFFRSYYQRKLVEPVILSAGAVHLSVSLYKVYKRYQRTHKDKDAKSNSTATSTTKETTSGKELAEDQTTTNDNNNNNTKTLSLWERITPLQLHRYSGYFLATFIAGHVIATRAPYWFHGIIVDLSFVSFSMTMWPYFFYPYYILLGTSGLYHMSYGVAEGMRLLGVKPPTWMSPRRRPFWVFCGIGSLLLTAGLLSVRSASTERFPIWIKEFSFLPEWTLPWKTPALAKVSLSY